MFWMLLSVHNILGHFYGDCDRTRGWNKLPDREVFICKFTWAWFECFLLGNYPNSPPSLICLHVFQPVHMADFSQVKSIQTTTQEDRGILQIRIAGAVDPLTITSSPSEVEDMADLIDGYCRLVHDINTSLWTRKGMFTSMLWFPSVCTMSCHLFGFLCTLLYNYCTEDKAHLVCLLISSSQCRS